MNQMNMDELFVRLMGDHQVGVERARFGTGSEFTGICGGLGS